MLNKDGTIIMVHSFKGGTGKTAISVNLARYLSLKRHKKVLLVEQDTSGSTFTDIFHVKDPVLFWNDFYFSGKTIKELITPYKEFDIVCAEEREFNLPKDEHPEIFYSRQIERFRWEKKWLKRKYDYIIFDTHPGYNIELVNSLVISDTVLLITRLDSDTVKKTIEMYNQIYSQFTQKNFLIIQNQVPESFEYKMDIKISKAVERYLEIWESFIIDKKVLTIPLKNDIAYPLSQSKILPFTNIFMRYIEQIVDILDESD